MKIRDTPEQGSLESQLALTSLPTDSMEPWTDTFVECGRLHIGQSLLHESDLLFQRGRGACLLLVNGGLPDRGVVPLVRAGAAKEDNPLIPIADKS